MVSRLATWLLLAGTLASGGCANVATRQEASHDTPPQFAAHRATPQFGLRIASAPEAPNLAPPLAPAFCANGAFSSRSAPLAALPSPCRHSTSLEVDRGLTTPEPALDSFLLACYGSPVSLTENGLVPPPSAGLAPVAETRFLHEMPGLFFQEFTDSWSEEFRMVVDSAPLRFAGASDPLASASATDPLKEDRDRSAWLRGQKNLRGATRESARDTNAGAPVIDQLRDWRNEPLNFMLAMMGGGIEQETPEGGKLILGPQISELSTADNPAEIFRVRYLLGPFEARAQTKQAWARYKTDLFGCSLMLRTAYNYLRNDESYQLVLSRPVGEQTSVRMVGGSGVGSETFTGYSPYPDDPREERRVALLLYLDHRF